MADAGVMLVADVHGLAGREPELRALLRELAAGARDEAGCRGFRVLGADDPGGFVLLATWTDEPALRAHYATSAYLRYRERVGPLLARPSEVTVHHLGSTVHPVDPNPPDPELMD